MSKVDWLLDDLDRYARLPRLIDVARDGPRAPSALLVLRPNGEGAQPSDLLSKRIAEYHAPAEGDWVPAGPHLAEVLEVLLGLDHDATAPMDTAEGSASFDGTDAPPDRASDLPKVEPVPNTGATAAQLQSLSEEISALREELAAAAEAVRSAFAANDEIVRERNVLRAKREDLLKQLGAVRQRRREVEAELGTVRDQLAEAEARVAAAATSELNADRLDRISRAAASIAARELVSLDDLFVVERLHSAVPEDPRVTQSYGLLLSRLGRHEAGRDRLASVPRSQLSRQASLALLRSTLALGSVPDDVGALVSTTRPSADDIHGLAMLTSGLPSARVLELTEVLIAVVPDEEMSGWLASVAERLTGRPLVGVLSLWAGIEPDRALHSLVIALADERLTMNDADGAALALDLDWLALGEHEARDLAQRLASSLARARDVGSLYRLLAKSDHLAQSDRHAVGTDVIQALAQIVPDRESIAPAVEAGVRYVEDYRQANRLTEATRLAGFVRQNLHRADDDTQALAEFGSGRRGPSHRQQRYRPARGG